MLRSALFWLVLAMEPAGAVPTGLYDLGPGPGVECHCRCPLFRAPELVCTEARTGS